MRVADDQVAAMDGLSALDTFPRRHVGPDERDRAVMLAAIGAASLEQLIGETIPASIRLGRKLELPKALTESEALASIRRLAEKNKVFKSFIGMGYYDTITPPVILRNVLENPGWYTQYTPYQAEIAQGRLEALLNFQTMVSDLTGLPLANASMLDEATAAAEAMNMCHSLHEDRAKFFVDEGVHPQTIAVVRTRAKWLGIEITVGDALKLIGAPDGNPGVAHTCKDFCGVLVQYPTTDGRILDYGALTEACHAEGTQVVVGTDLLALTLIKPPGGVGGRRGGYCGGQCAAVWGADGFWGAARGIYGVQDGVHAEAAGADRGGVAGCAWEPGVSAVDPDARAAYTAGEGDFEYLHGAGAAGDYVEHVCGISWAGGVEGDRTAGPYAYCCARRRSLETWI